MSFDPPSYALGKSVGGGGGGGGGASTVVVHKAELVIPSADGEESTVVHDADSMINDCDTYIYPGDFSDLGSANKYKPLVIEEVVDDTDYYNTATCIGWMTLYPANLSSTDALCIAAETQALYMEVANGFAYALLPSDVQLAKGTGK